MRISPNVQRILIEILSNIAEAICRNLGSIFGRRKDY